MSKPTVFEGSHEIEQTAKRIVENTEVAAAELLTLERAMRLEVGVSAYNGSDIDRSLTNLRDIVAGNLQMSGKVYGIAQELKDLVS